MTTTTIEKRTRAVNVQVPGEAPKQPEKPMEQPKADTLPPDGQAAAPHVEVAKPEALDLDAIRAQIREEERDRARNEIGAQIRVATAVIERRDAGTIAGNRGNYRTMRAADIDHTKLTAPVLSLDGWVCPPAPEAKK